NPQVLSCIMGLKDGDFNLVLEGERLDIQGLCEIFHAPNRGIHIKRVEEILLNQKVCDKYFKVAFTLFTIATLLCPPSGSYISVSYLFSIVDVKNIGSRKWASFSFYKLVQAITKYKEEHLTYINGCLLFMQVVVRDISCTNAVKVQSDRDNNVNHILSTPHLVIKKLDAQAEDIKGLSSNIIELTACVESQNKFLYNMMSMIKAWVPSKSRCDWDTFVKKDEKCMVSQRNRQTLEKTEEKYQAVDLNCEVIGIEKKISELKYKNMDLKHDVFVKVAFNQFWLHGDI
ncbi:hypothetical protein CISIN_1g045153mg, partial [Citrus sinensis]